MELHRFHCSEAEDRKLCQDVTVKRGAVCNTDHHLVVATTKFRYKSRARKTKTKRYDVGKLLNEEVERQEMCDRYLNEVLERTDEACKDDEDVAERWDVVRAALTTAAENVLGTTTQRLHQVVGFREAGRPHKIQNG